MKKSILIILGFILFISCKESNKTELIKSESNTNQSEQINEAELAVQEILDIPDFQQFYHPELKERLPVKVLESELIDKKFGLNKFGQKVRIMSLTELEKEGIKDYVEFHKLEIQSDTAEFKLYYRIEGAGSAGKLVMDNETWKILDYEVWEN